MSINLISARGGNCKCSYAGFMSEIAWYAAILIPLGASWAVGAIFYEFSQSDYRLKTLFIYEFVLTIWTSLRQGSLTAVRRWHGRYCL
jgi:hypothetical protein